MNLFAPDLPKAEQDALVATVQGTVEHQGRAPRPSARARRDACSKDPIDLTPEERRRFRKLVLAHAPSEALAMIVNSRRSRA